MFLLVSMGGPLDLHSKGHFVFGRFYSNATATQANMVVIYVNKMDFADESCRDQGQTHSVWTVGDARQQSCRE